MSISQVPSATRTLRVLRYLASRPEPATLDAISRACELPRSTAYHLLNTMMAEGFVVHLVEQHRYGLGMTAFEVGTAYARQDPVQRLARAPLASLVDRLSVSAYVAVPRGRDVLYVLEERAPLMPPLVVNLGGRVPARMTAAGRALLAATPQMRVRQLFGGGSAFSDGLRGGPRDLASLQAVLTDVRRMGYATEQGELHAGLVSVAAAVHDETGTPVAAVSLTHRPGQRHAAGQEALGREARRAADTLARILADHAAGERRAGRRPGDDQD